MQALPFGFLTSLRPTFSENAPDGPSDALFVRRGPWPAGTRAERQAQL
jgi:hypothetical protein